MTPHEMAQRLSEHLGTLVEFRAYSFVMKDPEKTPVPFYIEITGRELLMNAGPGAMEELLQVRAQQVKLVSEGPRGPQERSIRRILEDDKKSGK